MSLLAGEPGVVRTLTAGNLARVRFVGGVRLVPFRVPRRARAGSAGGDARLRPVPPPRGLGLDRRPGDRAGRGPGRARLLAAARAPVAAGRDPRPLRSDLRLSRPGPVAAEAPRPALTDGPRWSVLALAGVATFFVSFDGSALILD